MAKEVTKAPTGLKIARDGNKFTASWKIGDSDYGDGQFFQYLINDTGKDKWQPTKDTGIGKKVTSKVVKIDKNDFFPNKTSKGVYKPYLYEIGVRVKGNRKKYTTGSGKKRKEHSPSVSSWTEKRFKVNKPKNPSVIAALDEELTNVCKFTWSAPYDNKDSYIFTDVQWQSILVKNSKETDGSKLNWKSAQEGSVSSTGSKEITEDTSILYRNGDSYTRWFRVRARGPAGCSDWRYAYHVYALSHQANVTGTSADETDEGGFQCTVDWEATSNRQNPIDKATVQYTITIPDEDLTCPSGVSWNDANISRDTSAGDAAVFSIDDQLAKDQCLFIRVNTEHDGRVTYGRPQLSRVGFLKDPSGLAVATDNVTHKATITATNNSDVTDSVLVVRYVPSNDDPIDIGVIPKGSSSVTVQCPNWDDQSAIAFDVYAMVGTAIKQVRADGVDSYSIEARMRSQNIISQGGAVPVAPQNVSVNRVEGKPDTVRVTWDWPWNDAGSAEITWSDHDDAWESTDEPESFTISNLHASAWNISGLETGKTWYIRVRLIAGNLSDSEDVTYGPWSDIVQGTIDLSSAPNKPVLVLSDATISEEGSTTASWVYTTTDNTGQAYAEVAVVEDGEYTPIAHALTAQHTTIDAISVGFTVGNIYNLSCRVKSVSGKISEWSDIVSVTVAEPLTCEITETSLETQMVEVNPQTHEGNPITFNNPDGTLEFAKLRVDLEPTQDGTGDPSPSNVRPIHGVGEVSFEDVGKNLIDLSSAETSHANWNATYSNDVLTVIHNNTYSTGVPEASVKVSSGQYVVSFEIEGTGFIDYYKNNVFQDILQSGYVINASNNDTIKFLFNNSSATTTKYKNVQLEKGSTATTYEPYQEPIEITQNLTTTLQPIASDDEPYLMRAMPYSDATNLTESLVGGTVAWNQLCPIGSNVTTNGITKTANADGSITLNGTATANGDFQLASITANNGSWLPNHVYYIRNCPTGGSSSTYSGGVAGLVLDTGQGKIFKNTYNFTATAVRLDFKSGTVFNNAKVYPQFTDLTAMFGSTIADYIYSLEQATAGDGVAFFRKLFPNAYYPYDSGSLKSVTATSHDTVGFNQISPSNYIIDGTSNYNKTVGTKIVGGGSDATVSGDNPIIVTVTGGWRGATFISEPLLKGQQYQLTCAMSAPTVGNKRVSVLYIDEEDTVLYSYNYSGNASDNIATIYTANEEGIRIALVVESTTAQAVTINNLCLHLVGDGSRNGQYEPYSKHSYPLDDSLTLRGKLQLADGNLYYDGDVYESIGEVTRRYKDEEDLSSLPWQTRYTGSVNKTLSVFISGSYYIPNQVQVLCEKYQYMGYVAGAAALSDPDSKDVGIYTYRSGTDNPDNSFYLVIPVSETPSGEMIFRLATPTTESALPFADPQIVSKYGTEAYEGSEIPVGHNTTYLTRDIYGGTLDLVSGVLTVDRAMVDLGNVAWNYNSTYSCWVTSAIANDVKKYPTQAEMITAIAEKYVVDPVGILNGANFTAGKFILGTSGNLFVKTGSNSETPTGAFVYELATPIRTTLTSRELSALVGRNTLTGGGNMQIRLAEGITETECLTRLPLTVTVEGAGEGIAASIEVERAEDYSLNRPDEDTFQGHQGETVLKTSQLFGIDQVSFTTDDVIGSMDDGATYNIVATVQDGLGQTAQAVLPFTVHWSHQAEKPSATVIIDEEELVAFITPIAPENAEPDDVADIYRLSADKPELIVRGAEFGETYVDPFPALGDMGGHRIVTRTRNGDYITADNEIAMVDSPELGVNPIENEDLLNIIDFEGRQIRFYWETNYSNTWAKDFKETQYLGGAIEGDWNSAVSRSGTLSSKAITVLDQEMLKDVRRLADYPGICHVRTADGSSYAADVQVSEDYTDDEKGMVVNYSLSITRIGPEQLDGMTLEQWEDENPTGEEEE